MADTHYQKNNFLDMSTIYNIALHNFGGLANNPKASTQSLTKSQIEKAHFERFKMPSELNNSAIGYNIIVWPDGMWTQHRYVGEETMAQKYHNFDTLSICMAGNFTKGVDAPSLNQIKTVQQIIDAAFDGTLGEMGLFVKPGTELKFSPHRVFPHRVLQPNHTECYGNALSDDWCKRFAINYLQTKLNIIQRIVLELRNRLEKLQGKSLGQIDTSEWSCEGSI